MALVRCEEHEPSRTKTKHNYSVHAPVRPIGYPNTALICGVKGCIFPGLAWLDEKEANAYESGERVFSTRSGFAPGKDAAAGAKVRVQ